MGKEKRGESNTITTSLGSKQSIIVFFVAIILILGMFFMVKTYRELSGENIVVESEEDLAAAKVRVNEKMEELEQDKLKLRALVGIS